MTDAVEIVSDLVKIPSVSPFGRNETERRERFERCREVLAYLEEFLQKQGAQTEQLVFEGGHDKWWYPVPNLYAELTIGDRKAAGHKFLCYMGHIDVVPVGEEKLWRRPPFSGQIDEGFVWGRGATDMKGSVGAWMSALEELKAGKGVGVNLTIGTLITGDEEWAAVNGSDKVLAWMKANGKNPDAFIVGEPSSRDYLGTHIKTGRRGSLVGYLEAKGTQGHRAYEELFENPNRGAGLRHGYSQCQKMERRQSAFSEYDFRDGGPAVWRFCRQRGYSGNGRGNVERAVYESAEQGKSAGRFAGDIVESAAFSAQAS